QSKKQPPTPFRTSTLQQAANNRLYLSAKNTMRIAQQLYEGIKIGSKGSVGLITYMRTDSLNLSNDFLNETNDFIKENIGSEFATEKPRRFTKKAKGAQEAHEAIRPTHVQYSPESIKQYLDDKQYKLYSLIWQRAVASQMSAAVIDKTTLDINSDNNYSFRATGQIIKFPGFLKVYQTQTKENILPEVKPEEKVTLDKLDAEQHFTQPPARYSEASLIKVLEEYGIGRPSTYAPTIATIQDRKYVIKEDKKLKPTDMGIMVNDILVKHFSNIVDYKFTAKLEDDLDKIAGGKKQWQPVVKNFYQPFHQNLEEKTKTLTKKELTEEKTDEICEKCGSSMIIKTGRYGRFLACSNYPECKNTKPLPGQEQERPEPELVDEKCPECNAPLVKKTGRYGPFLGCSNYPECKYIKSYSQKTGVTCPKCEQGEMVSRRGKGGRSFYACDRYPKCKFVLWGKPTGKKCKVCGSLIIQKGKAEVCSNSKCTTDKNKQKK
ncbi:MAG TPA: type I DNA topoisomerase, partial [Patescibacteria group bacterium]|nr:type I DNA topoisomerase [Patescibacteria group bacterium]